MRLEPTRFVLASAAILLTTTGCPVQVDNAAAARGTPKPVVEASEKDPRVTKDGEDLYPAKVMAPAEDAPSPSGGRGTGKTDESNGYCRLFAPKLPNPECCKLEFGFDADVAKNACGHQMFLGESFQQSCGYYFTHQGSPDPAWMRTKYADEATPRDAGLRHLKRLDVRLGIKGVELRDVEGVDDAYWTSHNGLAWAWLPGWDKVRMLSWREDSCSPAGIAEVVAAMVAARPRGPREARQSLIPKALK